MLDEEAKAIQEVAKTSAKMIEVSEKIGQFIKKVIGDGLVEICGIGYDWAKYIRHKSLLYIYDKVEEIHRKRKIEGKTIPISLRYAIPLLQNASMETDESIQDLWAGLIANATDPEKRFQVKRIYIRILAEIEPLDALVLKFISDQGWNIINGPHKTEVNLERLSKEINTLKEEIQISLQNLNQLGCIQAESDGISSSTKANLLDSMIDSPSVNFTLTSLARSLLRACEI